MSVFEIYNPWLINDLNFYIIIYMNNLKGQAQLTVKVQILFVHFIASHSEALLLVTERQQIVKSE